MLDTETRMDNVMKKIAKISKLDDGWFPLFSSLHVKVLSR